MQKNRPPLYLITGIVLGLLVGFLVAYLLFPVHYKDTSPNTLSDAQKAVYRALVGRAYLYEADSGRAFSRLALLNEADQNSLMVAQSQQLLAANSDDPAARGLALLAGAAANPQQVITPLAVYASEPPVTITESPSGVSTEVIQIVTETPIPVTPTPFITFTPRPSATPRPTQGNPYQLVSQKGDCQTGDHGNTLIIYVMDAAGNGVPGVKLEISTNNGGIEDFYTGLYPEINNGYADYTLDPAFTYSLRVGINGQPVTGISLPQCSGGDGKTYTVNQIMTFKQQ